MIQRKKPLRRGQPPKRSTTPIKARGRKRFPKGYDRAYRAYISSLVCLLFGKDGHQCTGHSEPAHVRADATGVGDRGQLIPLCANAHTLGYKNWHSTGRHSFPAFWGFGTFDDLAAVAAALDVQYESEKQ